MKVLIAGVEHAYDSFVFSGGEVHVRMRFDLTAAKSGPCIIKAKITGSTAVMELLLLKNALNTATAITRFELELGYVPYGRQDRKCNPGEAFSLKVMADLINSMNFDEVRILDPHSDVTPALINNCRVRKLEEIVRSHINLQALALKTTAIAPDAGAAKKVFEIAKHAQSRFYTAEKIRDVRDGSIQLTTVHASNLTGHDVTIWDDICDGGRTFIELAKVLKEMGVHEINLFVTHGIFSKGYDPLFEAGISRIYTTDSFDPPAHPNVTIVKECF
jgi:ribose-phosphate pyrophosphokinase